MATLESRAAFLEELSFGTVRDRLLAFLATNQELAAQIGTVRELVSRNLRRLQAQYLIRVEGRKILIQGPKAIQAELWDRE